MKRYAAESPEISPGGPKPEYMRRASVRHQLLDTKHLSELEGTMTPRSTGELNATLNELSVQSRVRTQSIEYNAEI